MRLSNDIIRKPTALRALLLLREKGPMTLSALARELGTNKARLRRYMDMLASKGLVRVEIEAGMRVYEIAEELEL